MPRSSLSSRSVLESALVLADRDGFDTVTVSSLARSLGVQPASLYEHIEGSTGLRDGMHRLSLGALAEQVGERVAGRSARAALRGLADAHRGFAMEHPGRWAAVQQPASSETAASPEAARIAGLLLAVVTGYGIPDAEAVHAARLVGATINGFLALTRAEAYRHRTESEDDSWAAAIDALDRALSTWPGEDLAP